jgi:transcription antitermination factor NusA-like protein
MKLPVCLIDAQTNTLCRKCKQLYRKGKINDSDIELSKILVDLSKGNKAMKDITLYSSVELEDVIILVTRKQDVPILSRPEVIDKIMQYSHKEVRFLEKTNDPRRLVESLIHPIPVAKVSTLYIPPFSDKEYKIEIDKKYQQELPIPESVIIQTVHSVLNTEAFIEFT